MSIKSEEKRQRQEAAGIPDSRPFVTSEAEHVESGSDRMLACHINGVAIAELNLGPEVIAALDYYATDEGMAERNARPMVREPSGIEQGAGPFAKALEQKRDDVLDRDMDLYQARDPFKEVADAFVGPGMRAKMLSANKLKRGGNGDHQVVKYPAGHPHAGDPVMVEGMVLGEMPERRAIARNKHYQNKTADLLAQIEGKHRQAGGVVVGPDK